MNAKALLCLPIGHRWQPAQEIRESQPVLQCARCGRRQSFAPETRDPSAWHSRRARGGRSGVGRF